MSKPPVTNDLNAANPLAIAGFGEIGPDQPVLSTQITNASFVADIHLGDLSKGLPMMKAGDNASMPGLPSLNTRLAGMEFDREYSGRTSHKICAKAVREACKQAGIDFPHNPRYAREYSDYLPTQGFARVTGGRAGRFEESKAFYQPMPGDIVVVQKPGQPGHIAMYLKGPNYPDGRWRSDFVHNPGDMLAVGYRNDPKCTFTIFRHPSLGDALANAINLVEPIQQQAVMSSLGNLRIETANTPASSVNAPENTVPRNTGQTLPPPNRIIAAQVRLNIPTTKP